MAHPFTLLRMTTNRIRGTWCTLPDGPASCYRIPDTLLGSSSSSHPFHSYRHDGPHDKTSFRLLDDGVFYMDVEVECITCALRPYLHIAVGVMDVGIANIWRQKLLLKPAVELLFENLDDGRFYGPYSLCPCYLEFPLSPLG